MQTYRETDRHAGRQTDRYMHTLFTTKKPHLISTRAALISPVDTMHFLLVTRSRLSASCVMDTIHGTRNFWLEATFDLHFIHFSIHNHLASSDPASSECKTVAIKPYGASLFKVSREGVWCSLGFEGIWRVSCGWKHRHRPATEFAMGLSGKWSDEFLVWKGCEDLFSSWMFVDYTYIDIYIYIYIYTIHTHLRTYHEVWVCIRDRYCIYIYIYIYTHTCALVHMISAINRRWHNNLNLISLSVYSTFGINTLLAMAFVVYVLPCKNLFGIIWNHTFLFAL